MPWLIAIAVLASGIIMYSACALASSEDKQIEKLINHAEAETKGGKEAKKQVKK